MEPVNEALAEIKEDGTYEEIYERWIGRPRIYRRPVAAADRMDT